jgi:hypothetical protein
MVRRDNSWASSSDRIISYGLFLGMSNPPAAIMPDET